MPLIHGLTAPAALRIVLPHLAPGYHDISLAALWRLHPALLTMLTRSTGYEASSLQEARSTATSWNELFGRALAHSDEDVVKFTEACYRENAIQPDQRYAAAVLTAQHRIPRRSRRRRGGRGPSRPFCIGVWFS